MPSQRILGLYVGFLVTTLLALFLIKYFDLAYPINLRTSQVSSELSVVGEGKVDVKPDTATVQAGYTVNNASGADDAQKKIDAVSNTLVAALTKLGIAKADIKTSNYSVNPGYQIEPVAPINQPLRPQTFNSNVTYTITVRKLDILPKVLTEVTNAGANQIGDVSYSVEHPENYREQARNLAIQNAKDQAQKLASQLGIHLGRVTNIVESGSNPQPYPLMESAKSFGSANTPPDLEAGTQTISSTVTLYFEKN